MLKYTQKIRQKELMNSLFVFDHFVGLPFKGQDWIVCEAWSMLLVFYIFPVLAIDLNNGAQL